MKIYQSSIFLCHSYRGGIKNMKRGKTIMQKDNFLKISLCMLLLLVLIPKTNVAIEINTVKEASQKGPPYQVTIKRFIIGIVSDLNIDSQSISFKALCVCVIKRFGFFHVERTWYSDAEMVSFKQTYFEGRYQEPFICGFSVYTYSIHFDLYRD
jgi:hypothetical protein